MKRRSLRNLRNETAPPRRKSKAKAADHHHHVYVILLDPKVGGMKTVQRINPKRKKTLPCVYVGMTGLDPEIRFLNHKEGIKSSGWVKRHGKHLMPELFEHLNPMPFDAAVVMEQELAEDLRQQGYTVTGGH